MHRDLVSTLVIQHAQLRPSLQHGCLDMYLVSMKSDENWAWKEKNKLYVALNADMDIPADPGAASSTDPAGLAEHRRGPDA